MTLKINHIERFRSTLREIREEVHSMYELVAFGDASVANKKDRGALDSIFAKIENEVGTPIDRMYQEYPSHEFDQQDHPTDGGALFMARYMYKKITGEEMPYFVSTAVQKESHFLYDQMDLFLSKDRPVKQVPKTLAT